MSKQPEMPDWDDLQNIWQDSPDVDMSGMARHARFVWWRMRINFAIELLACLAGIGIFGLQITSGEAGQYPGGVALSVMMIVFCCLGAWAAFFVRAGAWGRADGTALSLVQLQIKRAKSTIRYLIVNNWGCGVGLLVFGVFYWVMVKKFGSVDHSDMMTVNLLMGVAVLFFATFPFASIPFLKRKRRELERLEALERQLQDDG